MTPSTTVNLPASLSCGKRRWQGEHIAGRISEAAEHFRPSAGTLRLLREPHILDTVVQVLGAREAQAVPAVGGPRWQSEHWHALVREFDGMRLPNEAAWATFTSGSTGAPRLLVRSAGSWRASFAPLAGATGLSRESTILLPVTALSSMTVFSIAHAASLGAHLRFPEHGRLAASDLEGVDAVHLTPSILRDVVQLREASTVTPRPLTALVGGDQLDTALAVRARAVNIRVVSYFGSAELSFLGVGERENGWFRAFPGVELQTDDAPQPAGRLLARTPYAALGTITRARAASVQPLPRDSDGWLLTDDLADLDTGEGAQRFRPLGRADGAILTAAATVRPEEVEAVLRSIPGVADALVFAIPVPQIGNLVAALLAPSSAELQMVDVRRACDQQLPRSHRPRRFWLGPIPRTASGKPQRSLVLDYVHSSACTEFRSA